MDYQQRIRHLALATLILGFIQVQYALGGSVVVLPPSDAVHKLGDDAQFFCGVTRDGGKSPAVSWSRVIYNKTEERIYKTFEPEPIKEAKYTFTQTSPEGESPLNSNIVVKNLLMEDAASYKCTSMSDPTINKMAELVVVERAFITMPDGLEDGKHGILTCDIFYMRSDNIAAEAIEPQVFMKIGDQELPTQNKDRLDPVKSDLRYKMTAEYNATMDGSHNGQNFTCGARVVRDSPSKINFILSVNKTLQIKTKMTKVEIPVHQDMYYPGDTINCTADGYPEPKLRWIPVVSDGAAEVGATLVITEQMMGNNTWKCRAEQSPPVVFETKEIHFEVLSPTEPPAGKSTGADTTTIVVAVVVPLAVLLAVLVVVCIVCKKKKSGEAKPKKGEGVEAGSASQKQRNQIYKPVATNPGGEVRIQEEKASYRAKGERPSPAPRQAEVAEETG